MPQVDILTQEIASWEGFSEILRQDDRKLFLQMLNECYQLTEAINSRGELYVTESLLMGLVFLQHKMIHLLMNQIQHDGRVKRKSGLV
jgi:hypothetical protein